VLDIQDEELDRAYESFTKAIEADPSLADTWANRATVLFKRGDLDGAIADLTHALRLREDANAFYNRGRVFEAQRKWTQAIQDYSRALDLAGRRPVISCIIAIFTVNPLDNHLGRALTKRGNVAESSIRTIRE